MKTLKEIVSDAYVQALEESGGNKKKAARILDVCIRTMRNYCHKDKRLHKYRYSTTYYLRNQRILDIIEGLDFHTALIKIKSTVFWKYSSGPQKILIARAIQSLCCKKDGNKKT